ncbi:unnamed protein product [Boreogadus saida]
MSPSGPTAKVKKKLSQPCPAPNKVSGRNQNPTLDGKTLVCMPRTAAQPAASRNREDRPAVSAPLPGCPLRCLGFGVMP